MLTRLDPPKSGKIVTGPDPRVHPTLGQLCESSVLGTLGTLETDARIEVGTRSTDQRPSVETHK